MMSKSSKTRREFLRNAALFGAAAGLSGGALTACGGTAGGGGSAGRPGESGETLFIAGLQWGPPTNFNPFDPNSAWPAGQGGLQAIYETLVRFNQLDGALEPGLATELQEPDEKTMVLPLQPDAKWQDGKPVTADDVVYTFEIAKRNPEVSYAIIWEYITEIGKDDDLTVRVTLNEKALNPNMVKNSLAGTYIVPKHVWEPIEAEADSLGAHVVKDPVGSGPYKVDSFNQQQIKLVRVEKYWGKKMMGGMPKPKYVVHPVFKENQDGDLALQQGEVDVSQQFTSQIWKMWEDRDLPVATWFKKEPYHIPGGTPMLVVNCTKKGLDNPDVRRALAFGLDYADIADKAMSRYSNPVSSSLILPIGFEKEYHDVENVEANGWRFDTEESRKILEGDLGAKKGDDGIYVLKDGTRLGPFVAQTPTGWSDYQQALRIVASNAKEIGIDIKLEFPQDNQVTDAVQNGDFDLALWGVAAVSPATPWQRIRDVLDSRGVPDPGERAFWNFGRFEHPDVAELLDKAGATTDTAEAKQYFTELDTIFMENAPMIPLMYRPLHFYEFNESNWTGFPTEKDPSAPPQFNGAGIRWLFEIERVQA